MEKQEGESREQASESLVRLHDAAPAMLKFVELVMRSNPPYEIMAAATELWRVATGEDWKPTAKFGKPKHLTPEGKMTMVSPGNGQVFTPVELQGYIGGEYEKTGAGAHGIIVVYNKNGEAMGCALSIGGSILAEREVYGNVLVCAEEQVG